jgi:hypothetical protein
MAVRHIYASCICKTIQLLKSNDYCHNKVEKIVFMAQETFLLWWIFDN